MFPIKLQLRNWTGSNLHTWFCQNTADVKQALKEFAVIIEPGDTIVCTECDAKEFA